MLKDGQDGLKKGMNDVVVKTKNAVLGRKKTKGTMNSIWKSFAFKAKKIKDIMNFGCKKEISVVKAG